MLNDGFSDLPASMRDLVPLLTDALMILTGQSILILTAPNGRYIQFADLGIGHVAQISGNRHLKPTAQVSQLEIDWLKSNGWGDATEAEAWNHSLEWRPKNSPEEALLTTRTLFFVCGAKCLTDMTIETDKASVAAILKD